MTPSKNYKNFMEIFESYGNESHAIPEGSYSIYKTGENTYEAVFLHSAGGGDFYQDPFLGLVTDHDKKKVYVVHYYDNFADAVVTYDRNTQNKKELDESLDWFLYLFKLRVIDK